MTTTRTSGPPRLRVVALISLGALCAVAVFVVILAQSRRAPETFPWGDTATTSIYTLRASRGELSTGAYSRFLWNHPGPLLYQVLAPLYRLSGYREITIKWTTLLLNLGVLACTLIVIGRRAPSLSAAVALALLPLLYREQRLLFWAWNPIVMVLPLALAIALASGVAAGSLSWLPALAATASFIVQGHVGFAPVVLAVLCSTLLLFLVGVFRGDVSVRLGDVLRWSAIALLVTAALWAVPIVHEVRTWPGNLTSIARFFLHRPDDVQRWPSTIAVVSNQLIGPFDSRWELTTAEASDVLSMPIAALVVAELGLLALAACAAWRRRARVQTGFAVICFACTLTAVFAVRSIVGPISDYLVLWIPLVGALNLAAIASEAVVVILGSADPRKVSGVAWCVAFTVYLGGLAVLGSTRLVSKHAADARSTVVRTFANDVDEYARAHGIERPILRFSKPGWEIAMGIVLQFYKQGKSIAVADDGLYLVGEGFRAASPVTDEFYLMQQEESALPPEAARYEWIATAGSMRLVRLFR